MPVWVLLGREPPRTGFLVMWLYLFWSKTESEFNRIIILLEEIKWHIQILFYHNSILCFLKPTDYMVSEKKIVTEHDNTYKITCAPVRPDKTQISLGMRPVWSECLVLYGSLRTQRFFMRTAKTPIRLHECAGWSESLLVLLCSSSI